MTSTVDDDLMTLEQAESDLVLNGLWVNVSPARFRAHLLDLSPEHLSGLRDQHNEHWYFERKKSAIITGRTSAGDDLPPGARQGQLSIIELDLDPRARRTIMLITQPIGHNLRLSPAPDFNHPNYS